MKLDCGVWFGTEYFGYNAVHLFSSIFAMWSLTVLDLTVTNHQGKFIIMVPPNLWRKTRLLFVRIDDGGVPHNEGSKKLLQDICKKNCKKV